MRRVYLVGRSGIHGNKEFVVEKEVLIGRNAAMCQILYPESNHEISGVHCKIENSNGVISITDMDSTNGTYLNSGVKLTPYVAQTIQAGQGFYMADKENSYAIRVQEDEIIVKRQEVSVSGITIAALALGILGILTFLIPFAPILLGGMGVGMSIYSLKTQSEGRKLAIAGLFCSIAALAVGIPLGLVVLLEAL